MRSTKLTNPLRHQNAQRPRAGRLLACLALALGLLGLAAPARASVIPMSLEEMVAVSDTIITVRVESTESTIESGKIFTTAKLNVVETFKGKARTEETIVYPGGKYGKLVMAVPAVPTFRSGEEAILFLSKPLDRLPKNVRANYNSDSPMFASYSVVGGFQGKIPVMNLGDASSPARKGDEPIPAGARVARAGANDAGTAEVVYNYQRVSEALHALVRVHRTRELQRGAQDRIPGIRGAFTVPERSADPVIRAFDPLPNLAYKSDKELAQIQAGIAAAEEARQARRAAEESSDAEAANDAQDK